jgi:hypothetical protein
MTSCLTNIACCAGNCLCHGINNILEDSKKINPKLFSRIGFIVLSFISVGFSLVILFFGASVLKPFNDFIHCPKDENFSCLGISSVYRMSLSLVILHLVVILFSLCSKNCAKVINKDCWTFKFLMVFGVYIGFFFISNSFFSIYAEISRYLSLIFMIYQITVTVSFANIINIQLVEGLDNNGDGCKYKFWLIFLSLVFFGASVYWIILSYISFSDRLYNIIITTMTVVFGVGFTVLSISDVVTRKRLLTSIYLFSYISYLSWSALNSQPRNNVQVNDKLSIIDILVGLLYLFLALCFLGFYIKKAPGSNTTEEHKEINKNPILEQEGKSDQELLPGNNDNDDELDLSAAYYYFQIFMIFMAIYYCMLLTNWNVLEPEAQTTQLITKNWTSFWIKISALVATVLLYIWVLIAPRLFPDREFDF